MMILFGFLVLALGGLIVALMVGGGGALMRRDGHGSASKNGENGSAREILDRRLARGEISREEYRAIRDQVES
jgi:uncharacterized membrane protein